MKNCTFFVFILLLLQYSINAQSDFPSDPLEAKLVTEDFDRFWKAFDKMDDSESNPFQDYIDNASDGLKPLAQYLPVDQLLAAARERKNEYLASRNVLDDLDNKTKRIQSIYAAMKYWYPESKFPPVYFAVGFFTSGGTVTPNGLLIGAEMLKDFEGLPALVAHELIHFQQDYAQSDILLQQCLLEGSADFIGELISGEHANPTAFAYGEKHEKALCKEFQDVMTGEVFTDWLYGTSEKDDRPNDLGYWVGYKIVEAYFNDQEDKHQAIVDILKIKDPEEFTRASGYMETCR